ncbi:hypothetical protein KFE25_012276 [Diacronema lutheri]|uniref:Uncharacterized protein n=1 Tax=Diacronema lutheri TaxID=2081491 RepID=A0A8J5XDP7_DIALT|nr:hypothetical protein KFE25_012276 [Diacronema lutheri]
MTLTGTAPSEAECNVTDALENALRQQYHPAIGAANDGYDLLAPARCHAHGSESPAECSALAHDGRGAVHVLRCHAHSEMPMQCFARGPLPVRMQDLWQLSGL